MKRTLTREKIPKMHNQEIMNRIKAIADRLKKEYHAEAVILFGSYATGEATEHSDVDLLVIAPTKSHFSKEWQRLKPWFMIYDMTFHFLL